MRRRTTIAELVAALVGLAYLSTPALANDNLEAKTLPSETAVLQRRLAEAGCYAGPLNGEPSAELASAERACPNQFPQLRIELGRHTAPVWRVGVDAACRIAASVSDDKTLRFWSLPDGKLLRTLRGPIEGNLGGKLYAVAVSPDGRFVAAAGWDAEARIKQSMSINIYAASTGQLTKRISGLPNAPHRLVFSPDGKWLSASLGNKNGVWIIDAKTWAPIKILKGYEDSSYGAAFDKDDALYTTSLDGKIRRYSSGPRFELELTAQLNDGRRPISISVDPRGELIAIGIAETEEVEIRRSKTLALVGTGKLKGELNGNIASVAWSADGKIHAGGTHHKGAFNPIYSFSRSGKLIENSEIFISHQTVLDLQPCGSGLIIGSADPAIGLVDSERHTLVRQAPAIRDSRMSLGTALMISSDGQKVRFGLEKNGSSPILFDLRNLRLTINQVSTIDLYQADTLSLPVHDWKNNKYPGYEDKLIILNQDEISRSIAILPKHDGFVLGTEWFIRGYNTDGTLRWPPRPTTGAVQGIAASQDQRLFVASIGDGTIRWYRADTGAEILSLFVHKENHEWIAWTRSGYYAASTKGENLIGWHVNRGWNQAADFFPASRFHETYSRPDIVTKILDTLDEAEAIRLADGARSTPAPKPGILDRLPPVFRVVSPKSGDTARRGDFTVEYRLRSPSGLPIEAIEVTIATSAGAEQKRIALDPDVVACLASTALRAGGPDDNECAGRLQVLVPYGDAQVSLNATGADVRSDAVSLQLINPDKPVVLLSHKPRLFVLAIGISHYADRKLNLEFADKDAIDFGAALLRQRDGSLYDDVIVQVLTEIEVAKLRAGIDTFVSRVGKGDVALIYFAGHGAVDQDRRYYLLAYDSDPGRLAQTAIAGTEVVDKLRTIDGRTILMLDACHAGKVETTSPAISAFRSANVGAAIRNRMASATIFVSSGSGENALERREWGNGAFMKAVLNILRVPQASKGGDRPPSPLSPEVMSRIIANFVVDLTGNAQTPALIPTALISDRCAPSCAFRLRR